MIKNIKSIRIYKEIEKEIELEIADLFETSFGLTMDYDMPDNYLIRKAIFRIEDIECEYGIDIINRSLFAVVLLLTDNFGHGASKEFEEVDKDIEKRGAILIDRLVQKITNLLEERKKYI